MDEIEERALKLIRRSSDGILQNQLWKELEIDSRRCTRIIRRLLDAAMVERESVVVDGIRTYRIRFTGGTQKFELLIAGNLFDPCVGCIDECKPHRCAQLNKWIRGLGAEL
ncbi:Lrp/AsnC family transcriptional regulator [Methanosarcinales archaeon]|nr:MAG: Lrp/AsnC family transcriptional regulator [Methanosarcinales archaeon]